jgi:hypothetical protein
VGVADRSPKGEGLREYAKDLRGTEEELNQLQGAQIAGVSEIGNAAASGITKIAYAMAYNNHVKTAQNKALASMQAEADDTALGDKLAKSAQELQQQYKSDPEAGYDKFIETAQAATDYAKDYYENHSNPNTAAGPSTISTPGKLAGGNNQFKNPTLILKAHASMDHTLNQHALTMDKWRFDQGTTNAHLIGDTAVAAAQNRISAISSTNIPTILSGYLSENSTVNRKLTSDVMHEHMGQDWIDNKVPEAKNKLSNTAATQMINTLFGKDPVDALHTAKMLRTGIVFNKGFDGIAVPLDLSDKDREGYETKLRGYENAALGQLVTDAKVKEAGATADAGTYKLNAAKNQRNDAVLTNIASDVQKKIDATNADTELTKADDTILPKVKQVYINGLVAQRGQYETAYEKSQSYMAENARILHGEVVATERENKKIKADDHRAALGEIHNGVNRLAEIATGNLGENATQVQELALAQVQQINAAQTANKISPDEAQKYIKEYASLIKASAVYTKSDPGVLSIFGVKSEVVKSTGEDAAKAQQGALNQFYTSVNKLQGMVSQTQTNITDFNMSPEQNAAYQRNVADAEQLIKGPLNPKQQAVMREKAIKEVPSVKVVKAIPKQIQGQKAPTKSGLGIPPPPPGTTEGTMKTIEQYQKEAAQEAVKPFEARIAKLEAQLAAQSKEPTTQATSGQPELKAEQGVLAQEAK